MLILLIRTVIIYFVITALIRLMGKRTIAELQVSELVITLLISDIAAVSMGETGVPLLSGLLPIVLLSVMEVLISYAMLKSPKAAQLFNGSPVIVINNGVPDRVQMGRLRLTSSDLMESLREKGIYDIDEVRYAIVETDGTMSVLKKSEGRASTLLIADGKLCEDEPVFIQVSQEKIRRELEKKGVQQKDVFMLLCDDEGSFTLHRKQSGAKEGER